jgi:hypothetical protein
MFPIGTHINWYVYCYFQAALIFPIANLWLRSLEKYQWALLDIGILIYEAASYRIGYLPFFIRPFPLPGINARDGHSVRFMVAMYGFSAYFGKFPNPFGNVATVALLVAGCYLVFRFVRQDIFMFLIPRLGWFWYVIEMKEQKPKNPGLMILGVLHVLAFRLLPFNRGLADAICFLGTNSFAILLFHDSNIIRDYVFFDLCRCHEYRESEYVAVSKCSVRLHDVSARDCAGSVSSRRGMGCFVCL